MKFHSHLNSAIHLLNQYTGTIPFAGYLKIFFQKNKKFGSTDRKNIAQLCYSYFRLGGALQNISIEEKILAGLFLASSGANELLAFFMPGWNQWLKENNPDDLHSKMEIVKASYPGFNIDDIFPLTDQLSQDIYKQPFIESHLIQSDLFLRIRPGQHEKVFGKLVERQWSYEFIAPFTVRLSPGFPADQVFEINKEIVIQDFGSQRVGEYFHFSGSPIVFPQITLEEHSTELPCAPVDSTPSGIAESVWDCCAASGGKSIMAADLIPNIELTVSDVRKSILINLKKRFREAGIKNYASFVCDLSAPDPKVPADNFDLIIADVPCSGSGTWGRNPEQLTFFKGEEIQRYFELQKKIVSNIIPVMKKGGRLIYITCSVFEKENENVIEFITEKFRLKVEKMELVKGYDLRADTMFVAELVLE